MYVCIHLYTHIHIHTHIIHSTSPLPREDGTQQNTKETVITFNLNNNKYICRGKKKQPHNKAKTFIEQPNFFIFFFKKHQTHYTYLFPSCPPTNFFSESGRETESHESKDQGGAKGNNNVNGFESHHISKQPNPQRNPTMDHTIPITLKSE